MVSMMFAISIFLYLSACNPEPSPAKELGNTSTSSTSSTITIDPNAPTIHFINREDLRNSQKVACADLDGDGIDEAIFFDQDALYWKGNREPISGSIQVLERQKEDGFDSLLIGTGYGKGHKDDPKSLQKLTKNGLETLYTANGNRNQIASIAPHKEGLFLSHFSNGTIVEGGWLKNGEIIGRSALNMAVQQFPLLENPDRIAIGRLYGDEPKSHGDLRILDKDQSIFLPTRRGVRALQIVDLNQDGFSDILSSDGWHYQYAAQAQARIQAYFGPDFKDIRTLANFDQEYTINSIELHQNGQSILARGNQGVYLLQQSPWGYKSHFISKVKESDTAIFCYAPTESYILISGTPAKLMTVSSLL